MSFLAVLITVIALTSAGWATTEIYQLQATIPPQTSMDVSISKVVGANLTSTSAVDFDSLVMDNTHNMFKSANGSSYCIDVDVNSNALSWTLIHAVTSMTNGNANLDNKINVTFMNQQTSTTASQIAKVSYSASNGIAINKSQISNSGWLRIYYGLATGSGDGAGTSVIPVTQAKGVYGGTITLTLAP